MIGPSSSSMTDTKDALISGDGRNNLNHVTTSTRRGMMIAAILAIHLAVPAVRAQEPVKPGEINLELNNAQQIAGGGCRLSVVVNNGLDYPLVDLGLEVVSFDAGGLVNQFLRLDFTRIASRKARILQFDLADSPCDAIGRLYVNDAVNCAPADGQSVYCMDLITLANRTKIEFGY